MNPISPVISSTNFLQQNGSKRTDKPLANVTSSCLSEKIFLLKRCDVSNPLFAQFLSEIKKEFPNESLSFIQLLNTFCYTSSEKSLSFLLYYYLSVHFINFYESIKKECNASLIPNLISFYIEFKDLINSCYNIETTIEEEKNCLQNIEIYAKKLGHDLDVTIGIFECKFSQLNSTKIIQFKKNQLVQKVNALKLLVFICKTYLKDNYRLVFKKPLGHLIFLDSNTLLECQKNLVKGLNQIAQHIQFELSEDILNKVITKFLPHEKLNKEVKDKINRMQKDSLQLRECTKENILSKKILFQAFDLCISINDLIMSFYHAQENEFQKFEKILLHFPIQVHVFQMKYFMDGILLKKYLDDKVLTSQDYKNADFILSRIEEVYPTLNAHVLEELIPTFNEVKLLELSQLIKKLLIDSFANKHQQLLEKFNDGLMVKLREVIGNIIQLMDKGCNEQIPSLTRQYLELLKGEFLDEVNTIWERFDKSFQSLFEYLGFKLEQLGFGKTTLEHKRLICSMYIIYFWMENSFKVPCMYLGKELSKILFQDEYRKEETLKPTVLKQPKETLKVPVQKKEEIINELQIQKIEEPEVKKSEPEVPVAVLKKEEVKEVPIQEVHEKIVCGNSLKLPKILKAVKELGFFLKRHGAKHDIFKHPESPIVLTIPRHGPLHPGLAQSIYKEAFSVINSK